MEKRLPIIDSDLTRMVNINKASAFLIIGEYPKAIKFVSEKLIDSTFYKDAVIVNWRVLEFIPRKYLTQVIVKRGILQNRKAVKFIPTDMWTPAFAKFIVTTLTLPGSDVEFITPLEVKESLGCIPEKMWTESLIIAALSRHWSSIDAIPENLLTEKMFSIAVEKDWRAFKRSPLEKRTRSLCEQALKKDWRVSLSMFPSNWDQGLCELGMVMSHQVIKNIPNEYLTETMLVIYYIKEFKRTNKVEPLTGTLTTPLIESVIQRLRNLANGPKFKVPQMN